jgi:hypothetical protein
MSQAKAFNNNITKVAATQPSVAVTRPPKRAADPAAAEHHEQGIKTPASGGDTADSRWPRWPNAWPDGSRQSRSRRAGQ